MGYNYYILIQGYDKDNNLIDLCYGAFSGTYSQTHFHYFYNKIQSNYEINYDGEKEMGELQYIIPFNVMDNDYNKYCIHANIDDDIINILKMCNDDNDKIHHIRNYIDNLNDNAFCEPQLNELKRYYNKHKKYQVNGFHDIKLLYGITF